MSYQQYNLAVSWKTQFILGLIYGLIILAILISPWPDKYWPIWFLLLIFITFEAYITQRKLNKNKGILALLDTQSIMWKDEKWSIQHFPFILSFGMFLTLRSADNNKKYYLWIAADSLEKNQWRVLRHYFLTHKPRH